MNKDLHTNCVAPYLNIGDALTFWKLTEDIEQVTARSVVISTEDPKTANQEIK